MLPRNSKVPPSLRNFKIPSLYTVILIIKWHDPLSKTCLSSQIYRSFAHLYRHIYYLSTINTAVEQVPAPSFLIFRIKLLELVNNNGPGSIVNLRKLVEIALGGLTQQKEHLPLVALYDLVVGRLLDERQPDVQEQTPIFHEKTPEYARGFAVDVLQACLLRNFKGVFIYLLVPRLVLAQLLLELWDHFGPTGHGVAPYLAAPCLKLLVCPLILRRIHELADGDCYDVFEVYLNIREKLLYALSVNLAIGGAARVIHEEHLAILFIDVGGALVRSIPLGVARGVKHSDGSVGVPLTLL